MLDRAPIQPKQLGVSAPTNAPLRGFTVLVVDDDETVREIATRMLKSVGYEVYQAADGQQAIGMIEKAGTVDLVITDIRMPNMDGYELAAWLTRQSPKVPILFMSGYAVHFGAAIATPVLPKPFCIEQLTDYVARVLERPRQSA